MCRRNEEEIFIKFNRVYFSAIYENSAVYLAEKAFGV